MVSKRASALTPLTSVADGDIIPIEDISDTAEAKGITKANLVNNIPQANVTNLASDLAGKAAVSHTHPQSEITSLVTDLASKAPISHTHVATTDLTATGTKDATTFLRGDDTWAVPPGGGGSSDHGALTGLLDDDHTQYQLRTEKNATNGYVGLDGSSKLTGSQQVYGSAANTAAEGNDSRLSDARTPLAHTHVATADLTATGTKDNTTFLRGDDTWAVPAGGGGGASKFVIGQHLRDTPNNSEYAGFFSQLGFNTSEVSRKWVSPMAFTLKNLVVDLQTNGNAGIVTISVTVNGVASALSIAVPAGSFNEFTATADVSVAKDDNLALFVSGNVGSVMLVNSFSCECEV